MEILPAIDLRGGQCVRLRQGATGGSFGPPVSSRRRARRCLYDLPDEFTVGV